LSPRVVPVADDRAPGRGLVEAIDVGRCEAHLDRAGILLEPRDVARPGDGDDVLPSTEDPGERELRGRAPLLLGHLPHLVGDGQVPGEVLSLEPGVGPAPVVRGEVVERAEPAAEEATAEWAI